MSTYLEKLPERPSKLPETSLIGWGDWIEETFQKK
jgi:hypothetical protein